MTRGRKSDIVCGDRVLISSAAADQGMIEDVVARSTLLYRSDAYRRKLIAANVTRMLVVVAAAPNCHLDLLDRCLAAAEHAGIAAAIVVNKTDLPGTAGLRETLALYSTLGYSVTALCARQDVAPLRAMLTGHTSVLAGQSGMGKSTIINSLLPGAGARTAELSTALASGRHTTTHARLYHLDAHTHVIDTPGVQEFGLHHITPEAAAHAFVEFRPWLGTCRFRNCLHRGEPGCAITRRCDEGLIARQRLESYRRLLGPSRT